MTVVLRIKFLCFVDCGFTLTNIFVCAVIPKTYRCTATKLQRRGNNVSVAEANTTATVCTLGGLQSGAEYLLTVRAVNSVSRSAAAELTIVMPDGGQPLRFTP